MTSTDLAVTGATIGNTTLQTAPDLPIWYHAIITLLPFFLKALYSIIKKKTD